MKIVVGGSMVFAKDQLETKRVLESMGYEVLVTDDVEHYADNPSIKGNFDEELKLCLETDIVRSFFNKIKETDAYLVVNKEKKGIRGYLGASVLMEIGLAYYLGKKIFLLEEIDNEQSYALEVAIINPTILGGDLSRVRDVDGDSLNGMTMVVCGSNAFRGKMVEYRNKLCEMGCDAVIHPDYDAFARGEKQEIWNQIESNHGLAKREHGYITWYHDAIINADAILVLNYDKKGIRNYIGGNTLMEIAFAFVNGKKVFLMNPIPEDVSYVDEIEAMYDKVLDGDLSKIDKFKASAGVSLKEIADRTNKIEDELGLTLDDILHKLTQECGEFNDAVQKLRGRYCRSDGSAEDVKGEVGDIIFNLSSVCNRLGINPDDYPKFSKVVLDKFERRKDDYRRCSK